MQKEFKNPSNRFRPIPFWSWNDRLDPKELEEQIREMKQSGVGGYFMHARSGLQTEYLSEDWFRCIQTGIEMAKQEDMNAWIYDEEGWPSGFAGGIVPALSRSYQAKFMTMETMDDFAFEDYEEDALDIIAQYDFDADTNTYQRIRMAEADRKVPPLKRLILHRHVNPFYVDTLNKHAIDVFLACTHEAYYERFGEDFGKSVQGFFTDEPRLACNHFGELAWSDELPGVFEQKYGYDILDHLPALYLKTGQYEKYRYDFWSLVNEMFTENYMKNIYDWCEAHHCKATGHIMMEESIFSQMTSSAGVMPFYEYLHIPGIDWLRRMIASPVIAKQVGSVACQLGKKQVLTESFALCGWNVSFEELKWIAEWQFVNGVNQICQHLMAYSIKGSRKRDYPPSFFTQQTWWKESHLFHDYLARLCVALSEGDQMADVLLIHPMKSGYVAYDGTRTEEIRLLDDEFTKISEYLSGAHISYHFGDETILHKYGGVTDGCFVVGKIPYKTVILPHMYAIEGKTVELLLHFFAAGGQILSVGAFPGYSSGSKARLEALRTCVLHTDRSEVRTRLAEQKRLTLSIAQHGQELETISYLQRETEQGTILFLVNHAKDQSYDAVLTVYGGSSCVTALTAEDGEMHPISYRIAEGNTESCLHFEPMGSHLLLLQPTTVSAYQVEEPQIQTVKMEANWTVERMDLNTLTLDYCSYRIDGGAVQGPISVIKLQELLLQLQHPCSLELYFEFDVDMDLDSNREFCVVIEEAQLYEVSINGNSVSTQNLDWWKDKSFYKVSIKPYVQNGKNQLVLTTRFQQPQKVYDVLFGDDVYETEKNKITYEIEIEAIYLLGDFGVRSRNPYQKLARGAMVTEGPFVVVEAPTEFRTPDFTTSGLLFFAGTMELSQILSVKKEAGKKIVLDFGSQRAPLVKVYLNRSLIKDSMWAPYCADITDAVAEGDNLLTIQIFASNRNLLGPHHHIDGECYQVGPESFTGKWSWVERTSEADATDIADQTKNYWTDTYSFVEFGFSET